MSSATAPALVWVKPTFTIIKKRIRRVVKDLRKYDPNATRTVRVEGKKKPDGKYEIVHILKPAKSALAYWDEMLRRDELTMDEGRDPGHRKLIWVGTGSTLEGLHEMRVRESTGRVQPTGAAPDTRLSNPNDPSLRRP